MTDWSTLRHAYGSAEDLPALLATAKESGADEGTVWDDLWGRLCHHRTVYCASYAALPALARLRREHHRLLGNGHCTRPAELGCANETICENCSFFQTSFEFRPTLQAQHDDAAAKGQHHRADLYNRLLTGLTEGEAS